MKVLVGDIGGTNARFALHGDGRIGTDRAATLACADFTTVVTAIQHYLHSVAAAELNAICLATAGPVVNEAVRFTNSHWAFSANDLRRELGVDKVRLINDFEAVAWAVPHLEERHIEPLGQISTRALPEDDFTIAIVGPGTGLGAGGLLRRAGRLTPLVGEGGHIGFAPSSSVQSEILKILQQEHSRVSAERLLSGQGVENIYRALCVLRIGEQRSLSAAKIFQAANSDAIAAETTRLFFELLGQFAGDMALTLGAYDGVYLAGGIVKRYPEMLHGSGFRDAFESKGRYRELMERIPVRLISYSEPGLLGAAACYEMDMQ